MARLQNALKLRRRDEITTEQMRQSADGFRRFPDCPITHSCSLETARLLEAGAAALERCAELDEIHDVLDNGSGSTALTLVYQMKERCAELEEECRQKATLWVNLSRRCAELERSFQEANQATFEAEKENVGAAARIAELERALTLIASFDGKTLLTEELKPSVEAAAAFNQCADVAKDALGRQQPGDAK